MNASLFTTSRNTHLKIVAVELAAAIGIAGIAVKFNIVSTKLGSTTYTDNEIVVNRRD